MENSNLARIRIDLKDFVHKMAYGIGQNWEVFDKPVFYPNTNTLDTMGVSSFGAIPHHTDQRRWKQIFRHAEWLGINFIRLEIEQAMYMPERFGLYDWDNNEMRNIHNSRFCFSSETRNTGTTFDRPALFHIVPKCLHRL